MRKGFSAIGATLLVIGGADIGGAVRSVSLAASGTRPVVGFEFGAKIEHNGLAPPHPPEVIVSLAPRFFHALPVCRIGAHLLAVPFEVVAFLDFVRREGPRKTAGIPGAARRFFADEGVRDFRPDRAAIGIGVVRVGAAHKPAANGAISSDAGGAAAERATIERPGAGFGACVIRHKR